MGTISPYENPKIKTYLGMLTHDNRDVVERPIAVNVRKQVIPELNKLIRTTKLPSGLEQLEKRYQERIEWPRSIYTFKDLMDLARKFEGGTIGEIYQTSLLSDFSHPFRPSTSYTFDLSLERNRRALKKGNGPPNMGSKQDNLAEFTQYNDEKLKPNPILENCMSSLIGVRTQQSPPEGPYKVRPVWGVPGHMWQLFCEAADSALTATQEAVDPNLDIFVFYTEPNKFKEWYANIESRVSEFVNNDATAYDTTVQRVETDYTLDTLCPDYEFKDLLKAYEGECALMTPNGDITRNGGKGSGMKTTGIGNSLTNGEDGYECYTIVKLDRYVEGFAINGDDRTDAVSTKLSEHNVQNLAKHSRRTLNTEKFIIGDFVWNSKWYIGQDRSGEIIMTRPVYRLVNSTMFAEREKSSIYFSKEYVALALVQQLRDVEEHPLGSEVAKIYRKFDKYHISEFTDEQLQEAAEAYIDAHQYMYEDTGTKEFLDQVRQSEYASL
jgi:hypothetical protein